MDINVDQADPRKDMIKEDSGKYLYVDPSNNKFDIDKFNRYYEQYRDRRREQMKEEMNKKLKELNAPDPVIPVYRQSIPKILTDVKDSMFNLLDDLLQGNFTMDTFIKNHRLFYLGIIFVIIAVFMYVYTILVDDTNTTPIGGNLFYIHHRHEVVGPDGTTFMLTRKE